MNHISHVLAVQRDVITDGWTSGRIHALRSKLKSVVWMDDAT